MPTYDYRCTSCGHELGDLHFSIADRHTPSTKPCPNCDTIGTMELRIGAPGVNYSINRGGLKTPDTFKDMLRNIKQKHRGSTINV